MYPLGTGLDMAISGFERLLLGIMLRMGRLASTLERAFFPA
jgi:hypothetical protein